MFIVKLYASLFVLLSKVFSFVMSEIYFIKYFVLNGLLDRWSWCWNKCGNGVTNEGIVMKWCEMVK